MDVQNRTEAGVRDKNKPDKTSAGDDLLRGPRKCPADLEVGKRLGKTQGVNTVVTEAQIHAVAQGGTDSVTPATMDSVARGMVTRSHAPAYTDEIDPSLPQPSGRDSTMPIMLNTNYMCKNFSKLK
jgi:hypothetical protein